MDIWTYRHMDIWTYTPRLLIGAPYGHMDMWTYRHIGIWTYSRLAPKGPGVRIFGHIDIWACCHIGMKGPGVRICLETAYRSGAARLEAMGGPRRSTRMVELHEAEPVRSVDLRHGEAFGTSMGVGMDHRMDM